LSVGEPASLSPSFWYHLDSLDDSVSRSKGLKSREIVEVITELFFEAESRERLIAPGFAGLAD
jgi:hypothetical protein